MNAFEAMILDLREMWEEFDDTTVYDSGVVSYHIGDDFENDMVGYAKVFTDHEIKYDSTVCLATGKVYFRLLTPMWSY